MLSKSSEAEAAAMPATEAGTIIAQFRHRPPFTNRRGLFVDGLAPRSATSRRGS
jgi:hypothetical protein